MRVDTPVWVTWYGALGNGIADDTAAIQCAINTGLPVFVPPGNYVITSTLSYITTSASVVTSGLQLRGAGPFLTIFDNRVANGPMLKIDTDTPWRFQQGGMLADFQITQTTSPMNSDGIAIRRSWQLGVENVRIAGLKGRGLVIEVNEGDPDGSVMVKLSRVWITGCTKWGIDADVGAGLNELSYLKLEHVVVASCGIVDTSPPPSGGMRWKGQNLRLDSCAFTTNENVGLFVYGGAGAAQHLIADGSTWENNKKVGVRIETLTNGRFQNCQLYNNEQFIANYGALIEPTGGAVLNVIFSGTVVRATSANNSYTAFRIGNSNAQYTVIENTHWQNFDHPGQTRYSDEGLLTRIRDDGYEYPYPTTVINATLNAPGVYTPDLTRYKIHRLNITAAGAYQIATPSSGGAAIGKEMILDIFNNSGGAIGITFSGLFVTSGFTNPSPGTRRSAHFYFNSAEGWIQSSGWTQ